MQDERERGSDGKEKRGILEWRGLKRIEECRKGKDVVNNNFTGVTL